MEDELAAKSQWEKEDLRRLGEANMDFEYKSSSCTFPMYTSPDKVCARR